MTSHASRRRWRVTFALALAAACTDTTWPEEGVFVARWDGRPWVGDARATLLLGTPKGDVLHVSGSSPRGADAFGVEESISAAVVFRGPGVYPVAAEDAYFMEITGGDVVTAWYTGVGSPAGRLVISRYDEVTGVIEGELRFSARTDSPYASYGSAATLENGKFRTVVIVQPVNTREF